MNKNSLLIFIASVAATGGLLFGFDTGVINVALPAIREQFALTPSQESNVVSAVLFGAMFGPFLSGFLTDILGRKKINIIASIVFVLGSIVAAIATSPGMLIFGRLLLGLAIGIVAATVPLYLAELSPKEKRGQMVTYFQLAITLGILLSYLVGYIFEGAENSWRLMFWAGFIPAILLLVGMFFIPESPRWLLSKGRESEAIEVLKKLRSSDDAQKELQETRDIIEEEKKNKGGWKEFFSKRLRIPLFIGVGIFAIQQFSGINAIIYYSTDIFKGMFSSSQATLATVGVGVINSLATIIGMRYLDKWGRKPILYTGLIGTAVCLGTVGLAFLMKDNLPEGLRQIMLVGGIYTYIIFFAISLGPLGWLLISEIYPLKIRGFASSMGSFNHWIFDAMVAYSFPLMRVSSLGSNGGIFFIYMVVVLLGLFFAKFVVFETKGLSLEDIEKRYI
ncbi:MAG: sugar porter family MFS transporter [Cytophagaceae bacterium]|nr:sugar porter family MFS transporter [Cytophagaceae bacterium]MBK9935348.1 sugar porter family MFS transporter [Cytophagaceae bacterium]MBL0301790.1 sugar porter family MFS transporter [Cytophagaceae bacterium]MBL0324616.1 sugar porter family MFS transporter [Cytophagaceae bacterium]